MEIKKNDSHGLRGHSGIRMDLLQNFVDVGRVRFKAALLLRLGTRGLSSLLDTSLGCHWLSILGRCGSWNILLGWHCLDALRTVVDCELTPCSRKLPV